MASVLIAHDADVDARDEDGKTPLVWAAGAGHARTVLLLVHQADVRAVGVVNKLPPLHAAMFGNSAEAVRLLLEGGADIGWLSSSEMTLLHSWALGPGNPDVADQLLKNGCDVNAPDRDGKTPLHHAVHQGQQHAVQWLLDHGAEVNVRDKSGRTPLSLLEGRGKRYNRRKDVADLLRSYGAR